jgi:hypothetical protein
VDYQCDHFADWAKIIGGGAALLLGLVGIIFPPLWLIDGVLVGGLITGGVAVGGLGVLAVARGWHSQVSDRTLLKMHEYVRNMHISASDLSKAAVDQNTNAKVLFIAFGEKTITRKLITDLCTSFATLKDTVLHALDDDSRPTRTGTRAAVCGAIAAGAAFGAGAVVATSQDKEWCTIM